MVGLSARLRRDPLIVSWRRAATLDAAFYEEAADEPRTAAMAAQVLLVSGSIGALHHLALHGPRAFALVLLSLLAGWAVHVGATYYFGTRGHGGLANFGGLARTLSYAMAPTALLTLSAVPAVGLLVVVGVWGWLLLTTVTATRAALALTTSESLQAGLAGSIVVAAFPVVVQATMF